MNDGLFLDELTSRNAPLYWLGLVCWVAALACRLLIPTTQMQIGGLTARYKPLKFFYPPPFLAAQ